MEVKYEASAQFDLKILRNDIEHFAERMRSIRLEFGDDEEVCHEKMDELMCKTLRNLGYEEGVEIFEETPKWYS